MADPIPAAPAAPAEPTGDVIAQVKTMVDLPETATDVELITVLVNIIANLQEKYEGLLADAAAMEDQVANRDLADFADIVPEQSKAFWKEQILVNRAAALETLSALRESVKKPEPVPAAPEAPAPSVPLRNRLAAITRTVETITNAQPEAAKGDSLAARIRNRAHEISKSENIPFMAAFARAEKDLTAPKE